jgi:hypothetical protein
LIQSTHDSLASLLKKIKSDLNKGVTQIAVEIDIDPVSKEKVYYYARPQTEQERDVD